MGNSYPSRSEQNRAISNVQTIGHPAGYGRLLTRLRDRRSDGHSNAAEKIARYVCVNITIVSPSTRNRRTRTVTPSIMLSVFGEGLSYRNTPSGQRGRSLTVLRSGALCEQKTDICPNEPQPACPNGKPMMPEAHETI
jgi:hypothetical protein